MRVVLAVGTTRTAAIDGISAAGADPDVMVHTPSADAEIVCYGEPIRAPVVPVSPTGTPTPALVTRAVRDLVGFDVTVVDAGLAEPTGAPTVTVGARPGGDVRDEDPVATAHGAFEAARQFGRALPDDAVYLGESIPGGTTTALGVQAALGERDGEGAGVSSSLPENPVERKREVVAEGLTASGLDEGDAAGDPKAAIRRMGDPVLAVAAGTALGCLETDTAVTLAGGTQLATVAALLRHAGVDQPLELATTAFVAEDPSVDLDGLAEALDLSVTVTDPGFDEGDHPAFDGYVAGEAKEGVAMGGALALARATGVPMTDVRERVLARYRALPDLS
ncbi:nicotinate mononucleotide-dependent phosphoribosyltransferase CobT [Halosimplex halophilum]|uniref:nicotinate mononucleotide-dependent phosphoribosyltransferase CobT n=1 Tax=Halosimplex halophilum TaxID=2559572 RepID=UPI00107F425E|nr:TIGR00303 family protein [Halosimplex halophilum]